MTYEMATLSGGCFLVMEAVFQHIRGVKRTSVGYAGGHTEFPCYDDVLAGDTGHSCVVRIEYDADIVNYATLLELFFILQSGQHNHLQLASLNCPFPQHEAKIFYHDPIQHQIALQTLARQQIHCTHCSGWQILPVCEFYPSEGHLQNFYKQNRQNQYSLDVVSPKIQMARNFIKSQIAVTA